MTWHTSNQNSISRLIRKMKTKYTNIEPIYPNTMFFRYIHQMHVTYFSNQAYSHFCLELRRTIDRNVILIFPISTTDTTKVKHMEKCIIFDGIAEGYARILNFFRIDPHKTKCVQCMLSMHNAHLLERVQHAMASSNTYLKYTASTCIVYK